jgi:hypothetical protein
MELTFFELFDWKVLLICAFGTSFVVSALNVFAPENIRSRYWLLIVTVIVVFLNTTFVPQAKFADWQNIIFQFLLNVAIALLFYVALGKRFVDKFFNWISGQIDKKLGKDEVTP